MYTALIVILLLLSIVADSVIYTLSVMLDGALVSAALFLFWYKSKRGKDDV